MKLNNLTVANAKPGPKPRKIADGGGMYLEILPSGSKSYRLKYRLRDAAGKMKEGRFVIGDASIMSLADARKARDAAKAIIATGVHPIFAKRSEHAEKARLAANTFASAGESFLDEKRGHVTPHYMRQITRIVREDLKALHGLAVREIETEHIVAVLKGFTDRPAMGKFVRRLSMEIFAYEMEAGRAIRNPAAATSIKLFKHHEKRNNPWLRLDQVPAFLAAVDAAPGTTDEKRANRIGVRLLALTMVRPNELAEAAWSEFDLDAKVWAIPHGRMKMRTAHLVPLSRQALDLLAELRATSGDSAYLFPERNATKRTGDVPQSPQMFQRFIREVVKPPVKVTPHGLRATASTALNDFMIELSGTYSPRFAKDWVECQLAHLPRGTGAHYNHASYLPQRAAMLQFWADTITPRETALRLVA